jgi:hypothetical protein
MLPMTDAKLRPFDIPDAAEEVAVEEETEFSLSMAPSARVIERLLTFCTLLIIIVSS